VKPPKSFLFFERRRQYPEREKQLQTILMLAEFLEYQCQYFPMDDKPIPTMYYSKEKKYWLNFYVPLCGNGKNRLLTMRLEQLSTESGLYIQLVPVSHVWDRRTVVRVHLTRSILEMTKVNLARPTYKLALSDFCSRMRWMIEYEEWSEVSSHDHGRLVPYQSKLIRIYPPEEGGESE
jgi:hypothetical protein